MAILFNNQEFRYFGFLKKNVITYSPETTDPNSPYKWPTQSNPHQLLAASTPYYVTYSNGVYSVVHGSDPATNYTVILATDDDSILLKVNNTYALMLSTTPQSLPVAPTVDGNRGWYLGTANYTGPTCFVEGTRLLTRTGYRAVESLEAGEEVLSMNFGWQPVRWVGRSEVRKYAGAFNDIDLPVRIARNAFGDGLPTRDLRVSSEHGIFFRGCLIPAKHLINGSTVTLDTNVDRIVYFHVLLDRHAVVYSEALPTESYIPSENQGFFENADSIPADLAQLALCRIGPMVTDCHPRTTMGPVIESARTHLAEHAPAATLKAAA
jgi:hypothetical protein